MKLLKNTEDYEEFNKKLDKFLDQTKNIEKLEDKLGVCLLTGEGLGRSSGEK